VGWEDRLPEYPATAGVVTDLSWDNVGGDTSTYGSRSASCLTILPGASVPSLIMGGSWAYAGSSSKDTMFQRRHLSDGGLDVTLYDGFGTPIYPGFGGSGDGTSHIAWSLTGGDDSVQSIVNDGTDFYCFMTYRELFDLPYPYSLSGGFDYWAYQKRDVSTGTIQSASMYLLGTYGPVPRGTTVDDFGPCMLTMDGNRLFTAASNIAPLGDLLWRIEKRKTSSFAYDSLFNTDGAQPGSIEFDPAFGVPGVPEHWTELYGYDGMPGPAYGTIYYYPGDSQIWHYTHYADIPTIPGYPDRAWAVTTSSGATGKIFVVGMDGTDLPSHVGQWRIECRNK
jgi:hypothetical protein